MYFKKKMLQKFTWCIASTRLRCRAPARCRASTRYGASKGCRVSKNKYVVSDVYCIF